MRTLMMTVMLATLCAGADKGWVQVEIPSGRATASTRKVGQYEAGATPDFIALYIKVQNTAADPLEVEPTKFYLKTKEGKALRCMTPDEAADILLGKTATFRHAVGAGVGGPFSGPSVVSAQEQKGVAAMKQRAFSAGAIPPDTFREGALYCEGSGQKKPVGLTLHLVGLTADPIGLNW